MSIHKKTLLIIGGATTALIIILITTSYLFILKGFVDLELESTQVNMHRIIGEISNQKSRIATIAGDWAPWDDTYIFIQEKNDDYIENNLLIDAIKNLEIHFMLFFNDSGQLIYETFVDLSYEKNTRPPEGLIDSLLMDDSFIRHKHNSSKKTGFIFANGSCGIET